MRLLMIDNYDSFTFNLVQYLGELGAEVDVHRNDALSVDELLSLGAEGLVISPGPGEPGAAGISVDAVRGCAEHKLPLLGVCLGCQTVNVAFGGSVIQHIEDGSHGRGDPEGDVSVRHELEIAPGTRLRSILGADRVEVNSSHHQAVGRVGEGLVAAARAPDGIVEAVEGLGPGFLLGIQWHPEEAPDDPVNRTLMAAFVEEAGRRRG